MGEVVLTFTDEPKTPGDVDLHIKCDPNINAREMTQAEKMAFGVVALYRSVGVVSWVNGHKEADHA